MIGPEDMLVSAVGVGPWPVRALREIIRGSGVTKWELERAVASLTRSGQIARVIQHYWTAPGFWNPECDGGLYVEGHSREQLIARLSARSRPPLAQGISTEYLMQGDDAGRLARESYGRYGD